jgi:hypothetical protein
MDDRIRWRMKYNERSISEVTRMRERENEALRPSMRNQNMKREFVILSLNSNGATRVI